MGELLPDAGSTGIERDAISAAQPLPLLAQQPVQQQSGWAESTGALVIATENRREIGRVCGSIDTQERVDSGHAGARLGTQGRAVQQQNP